MQSNTKHCTSRGPSLRGGWVYPKHASADTQAARHDAIKPRPVVGYRPRRAFPLWAIHEAHVEIALALEEGRAGELMAQARGRQAARGTLHLNR